MSNAFELKLIKLVRERKCLYHTKSRSSKNNMLRVAIWKNISDELGRSVTECKQRWRSLRDRFVREKKKLELAGSSSIDIDRWELYDALDFLGSSVQKRRQRAIDSVMVHDNCSYDGSFQSNLSKQNSFLQNTKDDFVTPGLYDENTQSNLSHSGAVSPVDTKEIFIDQYGINTVTSSELMPQPSTNPLHFENVPTIPSTSKSSSATLKDSSEAFLELIGGLKRAVDSRLMPEKDENDLFLQCIGKKMKRLSEGAKLRIQAKLLANVTEELLKE